MTSSIKFLFQFSFSKGEEPSKKAIRFSILQIKIFKFFVHVLNHFCCNQVDQPGLSMGTREYYLDEQYTKVSACNPNVYSVNLPRTRFFVVVD